MSFKLFGRVPTLLFVLTMIASLSGCGGGGSDAGGANNVAQGSGGGNPSNTPSAPPSAPDGASGTPASAKNAKRGIAFDLASPADIAAVSTGVSWWYNWSATPNPSVPSDYQTRYGMDFIPMLWDDNFNQADIVAFLTAHPSIKYMLVLNEPNLVDQANMTPSKAASIWPAYEAVAQLTGVKIVGPAMNAGTLPGYSDPVVWLDEFYADYRAANGRDPQIDYLAFHWYDYGLASQLDRLDKYGKQIWVTEFANWHSQTDGAQIDTLAKQEAQMQDMVATCESRADVFRYAWFTGRQNPDPHFTSVLGASGQLTPVGAEYMSLPAQ